MSLPRSVVASLLLLAAASAQTTVVLEPVRDGTLYEDANGALANGAGTLFFSGRNNSSLARRATFAFDLASIPAGSFVTSASLELTSTGGTSGSVVTQSLHRILASWTEGTSVAGGSQGGGAASTTGDATWIHRSYATTTWTSAGGDYAASATASFGVGVPAAYVVPTSSALVADVQGWIAQPSSNHGWLLRSPETTNGTVKMFASREATTSTQRPRLTITYVPGVAAATNEQGAGCPGTWGGAPHLAAVGLPTLGNAAYAASLTQGPPSGEFWIFLAPAAATSPTPIGGGCSIELDLPGATAFVAAGLSPIGPVPLDPFGALTFGAPIPGDPSLMGAVVVAQALIFDVGGALVLSNALVSVLGV